MTSKKNARLIALLLIISLLLSQMPALGEVKTEPGFSTMSTGTVSAGTAVWVDAPAYVRAGDEFTARLMVRDVMDLYGASLDFQYDPALLQVKSVDSINQVRVGNAFTDYIHPITGVTLVNMTDYKLSIEQVDNTAGTLTLAAHLLGDTFDLDFPAASYPDGVSLLEVDFVVPLTAPSGVVPVNITNTGVASDLPTLDGKTAIVKLADALSDNGIVYSSTDSTIHIGDLTAYEPNNTPADAKTITVDGVLQHHYIYPDYDVDWVKFTAQTGKMYKVFTTGLSDDMDTVIYLYGEASPGVVQTWDIESDDDSGVGLASEILWQAYAAGTYYVKVIHFKTDMYSEPGTGRYSLGVLEQDREAYLDGWAAPYSVPLGDIPFALEMGGINLDLLTGKAMTAQLVKYDDLGNAVWTGDASSVNIIIFPGDTYEPNLFGRGIVKANFTLPSAAPIGAGDELDIVVKADANALPGRYTPSVTATGSSYVWGVDPVSVPAGQPGYVFNFTAWYLATDQDYTVLLNKYDSSTEFAVPVTGNGSITNLTAGGFTYTFAPVDLLQPDYYWFTVKDSAGNPVSHELGFWAYPESPASPEFVINLPTPPSEGESSFASFDIQLQMVDSITDWSSIYPDPDYEVFLVDARGTEIPAASYPGWTVNNVLTASFAGIEVGNYSVKARFGTISDYVDHLYVDSYNSKPVLVEVHPVKKPAGETHTYFQIRGYNLEALSSGVTVNLRKAADDSLVATTAGFDPNDGVWYNVKIDDWDMDTFDVCLRAKNPEPNDFIPAGIYYLEFSKDLTLISNRLDTVEYLTSPVLNGGTYPNILPVGATEFALQMNGAYLNQLLTTPGPVITVTLYDRANQPVASTQAVDVFIDNPGDSMGWGYLKANFACPGLPSQLNEDGWGWLRMEVLLNGAPFPGSPGGVKITSNEVIFGVSPDWDTPGEEDYIVALQGWNLDTSVPGKYSVVMLDRDGYPLSNQVVVQQVFQDQYTQGLCLIVAKITNVPLLPVAFYQYKVMSGTDEIARVGWDIRIPDQHPKLTVGTLPDAEEDAPFAVDITVADIDWNFIDLEDDVYIRLFDRDGSEYDCTVTRDGNVLTATFNEYNEVSVGYYSLKVRVCDSEERIDDFYVDSEDGVPVLLELHPKVRPAGEEYSHFNLRGYNLGALASGTKVELKSGLNTVATTNVQDDDQVYIKVSTSSNDMDSLDLCLKASDLIDPGFYYLEVTNPATSVDDRLEEVRYVAGPVLNGNVNPWVLQAGLTHYTLKMDGAHLDHLDDAEITVTLKDYQNNTIATAPGVVYLHHDNDPMGWGHIEASFTGPALPDASQMPDDGRIRLQVEVTSPTVQIETGDHISVEVTTNEVVYDVDPRESAPGADSYTVTLKGWNLDPLETYLVKLYDQSGGYVAMTIDETNSEITGTGIVLAFSPTVSLVEGYYRFEVTYVEEEDTRWVGSAGWDVRVPKQNPKIDSIVLPTDAVEGTPFAVTVGVSAIDWNQFTLASDVNVWLHDRMGGRIPGVVTGPVDGKLTATFPGTGQPTVPVGYYDVEVRVCNNWDWAPGSLYVDSVNSVPVLVRFGPTLRPAGEMHTDFKIQGYNLAQLGTGLTINLKGPAGVVATNSGEGSWYNIYPNDSDTDTIGVRLRSVSDSGIPASDVGYTVEVLKLDTTIINRITQVMKYTALPMLDGWLEPWVLAAGLADYTLEIGGANLGQLKGVNSLVTVNLLDDSETPARVIATTTGTVNLKNTDDPMGWGHIEAAFVGQTLPSGTALDHGKTRLRLEVRHKDVQTSAEYQLQAGHDMGVEVTEHEVIYGIEPGSAIPGETSYTVTLKGWNLDPLKPYLVKLYDQSGGYVAMTVNETNSSVTGTGIVLAFSPTVSLVEGYYRFEVTYVEGTDTRWVGSAGWDIRTPWPEISISLPPGITEGKYTVGDVDSYYAVFTADVTTQYVDWSSIDETTDLNVFLKGDHGQFVQGSVTDLSQTAGTFKASFTGVTADHYALVVKLDDIGWAQDFFVDSYASNPVFIDFRPWVLPAGLRDFALKLEGYHFDKLSSSVRADLYYGEVIVATTAVGGDWEGFRVDYYDSADGQAVNSAKVSFKAGDQTDGIDAGMYKIVVTDTGYAGDIIRHLQPLQFSAGPILEGNVHPWVLPAGANSYDLSLGGYNLDGLNSANFSVILTDPKTNTKYISDSVTIEVYPPKSPDQPNEFGSGQIRAHFTTALPGLVDGPESIWMPIEVLYNTDNVPAGGNIGVEVTRRPVVYEVVPGKSEPAAAYTLEIRGWNLPAAADYSVELYNQNDQLVPVLSPVTNLNSSSKLIHSFGLANPLPAGDYWFRVKADGNEIGKASWRVEIPQTVIPGFTLDPDVVTAFPADLTFTLPDGVSLTDAPSVLLFMDSENPLSAEISLDGTAGTITITTPVSDGSYEAVLFNGEPSEINPPVALGFFLVDTTPPEIEVIRPLNGATVNVGDPEIRFSLTDTWTGVDLDTLSVMLGLVDMTSSLVPDGDNQGEYSFRPFSLPNGSYTVTVDVADNAGNILAPSYQWSFTVDLEADDVTPPVITPIYPAPNAVLTDAFIDVAFEVADEEGGSGVNLGTVSTQLELNGTVITADFVYLAAAGRFVYSPSAGLLDGQYTVTVSAEDNDENPKTYEWSFLIDTTPPVVEAISPSSTLPVTTDRPEIRFSVTDAGSGVNGTTLTAMLGTVNITGALVKDGNEYFYTPTSLPNDSYTVTVTVTDNAGNALAAPYEWSFTVDASVVPVVTEIVISGPSSVIAPLGGVVTAKYDAAVKDQDGNVLSAEAVIWSLNPGATGVSIDNLTGMLTATAASGSGSVTVVATSAIDGNVTEVKEVALVKAAAEKAEAVTIHPQLVFDRTAYGAGSTMEVGVVLTDPPSGSSTVSAEFRVIYDSSVFILESGDPQTDIVNGYLTLTNKADELVEGTIRQVVGTYVDMNTEIALEAGVPAFSIKLRVKDEVQEGTQYITLLPAYSLDNSFQAFNIANGYTTEGDALPFVAPITIASCATIDGYLSIYLGDAGTGINNLILGNLNKNNPNAVSDTYGSLTFTVKVGAEDPGTTYSGAQVFIPVDGKFAAKDAYNKVTGRFGLNLTKFGNATITVSGVGYLAKTINITLTAGEVSTVGTADAPVIIYPGDLGRISGGLRLEPDGYVNNVDFSAWLKIYRDNLAGAASVENRLKADLTKDGFINNVDFSLWLASYRKLLTIPK